MLKKYIIKAKIFIKEIPFIGNFCVDIYKALNKVLYPTAPLLPHYEFKKDSIIVNHTAGCFSCYTIRLEAILNYYSDFQKPPLYIDCSKQFQQYKKILSDDISSNFFIQNNELNLAWNSSLKYLNTSSGDEQFLNYENINYENISPFIEKYFTPSNVVKKKIQHIEQSLSINYSNICGIRYRGSDKSIETIQPEIIEVLNKALLLKNKFPKIQFLLLSDEIKFINKARILFGENCLVIQDDYHCKLSEVMNFTASVIVMSKCKYLISTSGNAELWMRLFRGNNLGCLQWLRQKKYIHGVKNQYYNHDDTKFWHGELT
jgi:hypothetical protein